MSDGTVGHLRVGQASDASDFRPLVAPAAALPQVQCQTFSMSDIERSWRGKMASQGHFAPSQGRDSGFAAASVIVIISRRYHRARRRTRVFYRNNLKTGSFSPLSVIVITRRASVLPPVQGRSPGKRRTARVGGRFVHTFTMGVQVCVSCEIFHLTAHFTANHRRA